MRKFLSCGLVLLLALSLSLPGVAEEARSESLYGRTTLHGDFDTAPLEEEAIDLLLRAGFSGPTGGNQRSLDFFVVTDRAVMRGIQEGHPFASALDTAPLVIVIAGDESTARYPELHEMDSGIAAMAMMVQAADLGLASCVLSISPQESRVNSARSALSMPDTMTPVLMVAFGYPATDAVSSASVEAYNAAQVHVNGYTGAMAQDSEGGAASDATSEATPDTEE